MLPVFYLKVNVSSCFNFLSGILLIRVPACYWPIEVTGVGEDGREGRWGGAEFNESHDEGETQWSFTYLLRAASIHNLENARPRRNDVGNIKETMWKQTIGATSVSFE